jgi:hypothetical protein
MERYHGAALGSTVMEPVPRKLRVLRNYVSQDISRRGHQCRKVCTFRKIAKLCHCRGLNSCHPHQELGALTKEQASPLRLSGSRQASLQYVL